jgi:RNA polymerase sigma-70 factor (ECF subfamily)
LSDFLDEMHAAVPALRRYARSLTRDIDRADDLVQDCLERAIRKRGLWQPTGPLRAWLFRMLLNIHRNDARSRRRRGEHTSLDEMTIEPATLPSQPGHMALAEVARALDRLPDEQREALLLVVVEGASYTDAANILGIPAGTLMSRLGRARAALRTLTGTGEEPRLRTVK